MKFMKLLLAISIVSSAPSVKAQDEPAEKSDVVIEGKHVAVEVLEKQLQTLQAELEKARAEAVLRAEQLQAKERALVEHEKQMAGIKREAEMAEKQIERARKAAEESMLQVEKAKMEAEKAKMEAEKARLTQELGIEQYKAMLQLVEKKQGPDHAYSQQLKAKLTALEQELAAMSKKLGSQHPHVVQTRKRLESMQLQMKDPGPSDLVVSGKAQQVEDKAQAALSAVEAVLAGAKGVNLATNPEAAEKLRARIADETVKAQLSALAESRAAAERTRALYEQQLVSRKELAEQENAVALQLRRTQEMLEMQKRLLSAENLSGNAVVMGHYIKPDSSAERFDRLEQKLDKIASLLEKLVEAKE